MIKTHTIFMDKECLLEALKAVGTKYTVEGNTILTDRVDYYGPERFVWEKNRFIFTHDSSANSGHYLSGFGMTGRGLKEWTTVSSFLKTVDIAYKTAYYAKLERLAEEERRAEVERKHKIVEEKRSEIIARAKEEGYYIKESSDGKNIQLVLTRTV
ncbi:MAG: hypothetical protein FWH44_00485 [Methanomassiliicoccaceae archaeon]|nr:hypothetical protein [Methanomassiliicoccaceae archaeon]